MMLFEEDIVGSNNSKLGENEAIEPRDPHLLFPLLVMVWEILSFIVFRKGLLTIILGGVVEGRGTKGLVCSGKQVSKERVLGRVLLSLRVG